MNINRLYDCAVIGGGPAGASTAYHLVRLGYSVVVLERQAHPLDKVCGEFLSGEALDYLGEMGIDLADGLWPRISNFRILSPRRETRLPLPQAGVGISRKALDTLILNRAGEAGAYVQRGCLVRDYARTVDGFEISCAQETYASRSIFLATGKQDLKRSSRSSARSSYIGFKCYLETKPGVSIQSFGDGRLFTFPGGYGGLTRVEGGRINFCFIIDSEIYRREGCRLDPVLVYLRSHNERAAALLQQLQPVTGFQAVANMPYGYLHRPDGEEEQGVFRVGDQYATVPSLTGSGIALALATGKYQVEDFHRLRTGGASVGYLQRRIRRQMRWSRGLERAMGNPWALERLLRLSDAFPTGARTLFYKTRAPGHPAAATAGRKEATWTSF